MKAKNDSVQQNIQRANMLLENRIHSVKSKDKAKAIAMEQQNQQNKQSLDKSLDEKAQR